MKQLNKLNNLLFLFILLALSVSINVSAQVPAAGEPTLILRYFINNNSAQYILVQTVLKEGKKSKPLPKKVVKLFLDSSSDENLLAKIRTDENGKARVIIPPAFKDKWKGASTHKFIGILETNSEETIEIGVTRAKLTIDTTNTEGTRAISATIMAFENNEWVPAKDVEMKIGISRLGGELSVGDEATYTTDSTGIIDVELKKLNLPGDIKGNFVLVAKVEDNEQYGNLVVEKIVPWGTKLKPDTHFFDQRTLWSTRFRTPFWLLFLVYAIVIGVWGTIIYLVWQIVKINKLGKAVVPEHSFKLKIKSEK